MKGITKISDLSVKELNSIIEMADRFRVGRSQGISESLPLAGRFVALVFEKPSLRTKVQPLPWVVIRSFSLVSRSLRVEEIRPAESLCLISVAILRGSVM